MGKLWKGKLLLFHFFAFSFLSHSNYQQLINISTIKIFQNIYIYIYIYIQDLKDVTDQDAEVVILLTESNQDEFSTF